MSTSPRLFALAASLVFAVGIGLVTAVPSQAAPKMHKHHRTHHRMHHMHHAKHMAKVAKK